MAQEKEKTEVSEAIRDVIRMLFLISKHCRTEEQMQAYEKAEQALEEFKKVMYENN